MKKIIGGVLVLALALTLGLTVFAPAAEPGSEAAAGPSPLDRISVTFREVENGAMALDFRVHNVRSDTYVVYLRFNEAVVHSVTTDGAPAPIAEGLALMGMPNGDIATDERLREVLNTDSSRGWNYIQTLDLESNYYNIIAGAMDKRRVEQYFGAEPGRLQLTPPESGLGLYTLYFKLNDGKTLEDFTADTFRIESSGHDDAKNGVGIIAAGHLVANGLEWIGVPGKTEADNRENNVSEEEEGDNNGGGPAGPSPDPQDAPALNTADHFRYIYGYEDNSIHPDSDITREEVAAIFYRLLTPEYRKATREYGTTFPDVEAGRWSAGNIGTMQRAKVITGYPDGTFGPANKITRAEFATIVTRFDTLPESASHGFNDVAEHWAERYIAAAAENGWINGYPDGSFRPDRPITRAEAMTMIDRVLDRKVDAAGLLAELTPAYTDVTPSHWAYYDVLEATVSHDYERRSGDAGVENWTGPGKDMDFDA
jgi:hypothetical protein